MSYWTCDKRGDCCREPKSIVMTVQEAERLHAVAPVDIQFKMRFMQDRRFVEMAAHPCPLLSESGECRVYADRPYNCRRFMCLRAEGEAWKSSDDECGNLLERVNGTGSYQALAFYRSNERRHRPWADSHGWTSEMRA